MPETLARARFPARSSDQEADDQFAAGVGGWRDWTEHVIVCGFQTLGVRTVEQLHLAGARVVVVDDESVSDRHVRAVRSWGIPIVVRGGHLAQSLADAGIAGAEAVIVIESTDLKTLE